MKDSILLGTGNSRYLKSVEDFKTRYPTYEAFADALIAGALPVDLNGINRDGFQQVGDALNTGNLLQDSTCEILGIPSESVPNDAFAKLALGIGKYGYVIKVTFPDGTPAPGVSVSGILSPLGKSLITDGEGIAVGVSEKTAVSVSFSHDWKDIAIPETVAIQSSGIITEKTIALQYAPYITITSSIASLSYSKFAKAVDITAVGAGAGGAGAAWNAGVGGPGGGGGYVTTQKGVDLSESPVIKVAIGKGGAPAGEKDASDGGTTTVSVGNTTVTAKGGKAVADANWGGGDYESYPGGIGNGNGGRTFYQNNDGHASPGGNATGYIFDEQDLGPAGGGGGAGGTPSGGSGKKGGTPYGGGSEQNGNGPGGGGGGESGDGNNDAGRGSNGAAYLRFIH